MFALDARKIFAAGLGLTQPHIVRSDRDTSASDWACCFFCDTDLEQAPACVTEDDDAGKTSYSIE